MSSPATKRKGCHEWFTVRQLGPDQRYVYVDSNRYGIVLTNCIFFIGLHLYYFYAIYILMSQRRWYSWIWIFWYGWFGGLGVSVGAHRLWAHRTYRAKLPLRILLIALHTMAGQNDMFTWVRDHRLHHKYTETDADPHNSRRGAFFAHVGWLLTKKHPDVHIKGETISNEDILADPVCRYQKRFYVPLYFFFRLILPMTIPIIFFGERLSSAFIGVFAQYITSLHITWFVNSAAHIFGERPYNDKIQPRENKYIQWITLGEGHHNYHHAFPYDFRLSESGYHGLDPARKFIDLCTWLGQAYDLKMASDSAVESRKAAVRKRQNGLEFYSNQDHPYLSPQPYLDTTNHTVSLLQGS